MLFFRLNIQFPLEDDNDYNINMIFVILVFRPENHLPCLIKT